MSEVASPSQADRAPAPSTAERDAWIALAAVDGLGEVLLPRLCAAFGGATVVLERALTDPPQTFGRAMREAAATPVRGTLIDGIRAAADDPTRVQRRVGALGGWVLTPWDETFPRALRTIDPPPAVLYGQGDVRALGRAPWWRWWARVGRRLVAGCSPPAPRPPSRPTA